MNKPLVFGGLLIVAVIGYAAIGPLITIYQIKSALEQQDSEKLSEYVDFPTLRANLKEQINTELMKKAMTESKDKPFRALGLALAPKLAEGLIDSFVTPSGISSLMAGRKPQLSNGEQQSQESGVGHPSEALKNSRYTYDSLSKFSVWVKSDKDEEIRFVLIRGGLWWKLSNIIIPMHK